jgi:putative ABC transport system permease protein
MTFSSAIWSALGELLVNKGRTGLTSLGIIIGISAVVALVSAGDGARSKLDERLGSVGRNLILIRPGGRTQLGLASEFAPLTRADADAIRKEVGSLLIGVAPEQITQRLALSQNGNSVTAVNGVVPDLQSVRQWELTSGRFINQEDLKKTASVCLVGQTVCRKLFPNRADPIGEWVRVEYLRFKVVGVLKEKGRAPTGADQDDQIFIPLTTFQRMLVGTENIDIILATASSQEVLDQAEKGIVNVLRRQHRLHGSAPNDFDVSSVREMAEFAEVLTVTLQALVGIIASISLLVGGVGIMNIMLVSVTERTREIGIRMAVGATPGDVLIQFLIEAVLLALTGGLIGIICGIAGASALAEFAGWPLVLSPGTVALAFCVSASVGILFGLYPSAKAARLDPIDALHIE